MASRLYTRHHVLVLWGDLDCLALLFLFLSNLIHNFTKVDHHLLLPVLLTEVWSLNLTVTIFVDVRVGMTTDAWSSDRHTLFDPKLDPLNIQSTLGIIDVDHRSCCVSWREPILLESGPHF